MSKSKVQNRHSKNSFLQNWSLIQPHLDFATDTEIEKHKTMKRREPMYVIKRDGRHESVLFDKITSRIKKLCYGLDEDYVDPVIVSQKVCLGVKKGMYTYELDELAAETAAHLTSHHPDYGILAARLCVSNLHKETSKSFYDTMKQLHEYCNRTNGDLSPKISDETWGIIQKHNERLSSAIIYDRDYSYDYFGFKTLERAYLLKIDGKIVERPQHMLMRVSIGIHGDDIDEILQTYELMSKKWFTHATPTLFNSGTCKPQLSSCFLLTMEEDSIRGIYNTLGKCAEISKYAGGIGISMHKIRASGSYIHGTNGHSNGLIPMIRVYNNTARYVDQGGGRRKGSFAVYLEPWHADVFAFLDLKKNHGKEEDRARDLFYALWVPDLFMKRVDSDGDWSLFCPNEAPGLPDCYGDEFEALYERYEKEGRARETIKARKLWQKILQAQTETGTPYFMFKDACNRKSNQKNLGTIRSSNLCTEILEYTAPDEVAVCNLASIALPMFVNKETKTFDHERLAEVTKVVTKNLNRVIDRTFYPIPEARNSNLKHRPIGIGVQGLADTFLMLRIPFASPEAKKLNREIFETMYFASCTASKDLAIRDGAYETFQGSPASEGLLQFDLWDKYAPDPNAPKTELSGRWDWDTLKKEIQEHGLRNSLLLAPMPTASTAQILSNIEAFEPLNMNVYVRRTLAGEFVCVVRHLLTHLIELDLWNERVRNQLIANNGSIQNIDEIPDDVKELYKTVYEISGKDIIDMAADRGRFIDQSQSMNVHIANVNYGKLTSNHFRAWRAGLKSASYYIRTKAAVDAIKFTVDQGMLKTAQEKEENQQEEQTKVDNDLQNVNSVLESECSPSSTKASLAKPSGPERSLTSTLAERTAEEAKQEAAMLCSLENRDACLSCGS